jgi:leucyl-tRNA synthetase
MCGPVVVPESDLPVVLPELEKDWEPAGDGRGPLAKVKEFMEVKCPKCGAVAKREADVMDNFLDSAWYFFRYIDPKNQEEIFNKELGKKWLPVDLYVGGNEHAVLHLMYTRFITMFLNDLGLIDFDNPFKRFRANGMILKDGKKMSKSKGNVINPEEYGEKVGYDALKTYILFLGPLSEDRSFSDEGVLGTKRWIEKISRLEEKLKDDFDNNEEVIKNLHKTIKAVSDDFEDQKYNTAVARLMEMTNILSKEENISKDVWEKFLSLIAPFAPALAEEMWSSVGNKESIFKSKNWPEYNLELARDDMIEMVIQVNGKVREKIEVDAEISEEKIKKIAEESEAIKKWIDGKEIIKQIFIKGKLLNIVVK